MNRELHKSILRFVEQNTGATIPQVGKALKISTKSMNRYLHLLAKKGQLTEELISQKWHFAITDAGRESLIPVEAEQPAEQPINSVCGECRQQWQGYEIHKIFGSSRA